MINGAVLGSPISHSLSPQLHKVAYDFLKIIAEYARYEVESGDLPRFLTSHPELNSLSLTMPLKEEALKIADVISPISLQIKSGNTLSKQDGRWNLTSTDVDGFCMALRAHNVELNGSILII
jgi:shikimate dehydrogenase